MQEEVAGGGLQMLAIPLQDASWKTNVSNGEMWRSSSVGFAPGSVREVCFDSCNSSSLIPLQVLGVMVCIPGLMISDLQEWLMEGIEKLL